MRSFGGLGDQRAVSMRCDKRCIGRASHLQREIKENQKKEHLNKRPDNIWTINFNIFKDTKFQIYRKNGFGSMTFILATNQ